MRSISEFEATAAARPVGAEGVALVEVAVVVAAAAMVVAFALAEALMFPAVSNASTV